MLNVHLRTSDACSEARYASERARQAHQKLADPFPIPNRTLYAIYTIALIVSISIWFIAIRAPLWLDETHSFYVIKGGLSEIRARMGWPIIPIYPYILWFSSRILGTSEIALRTPSIVAMLGAVYLLYQAAIEVFDRDIAIVAAIVFCLHPVVISASIDVRPYAFAALAINASILVLTRLRHSSSNWLAALFGLLAASISHFQFIFTIILPVLAICFFVLKPGNGRTWRQAGIAFAAFAVAFSPVISVLRGMFQTRATHVFDATPPLGELVSTLTLGGLALILVGFLLLAAATRHLDLKTRPDGSVIFLCASLGLVPILVLYGVSVATPVHVFVERYRLVAIPGIALCWALLVNQISSRALRLMFCIALVATAAYLSFASPLSKLHEYTWKYALEFVATNTSSDSATVLICSDFPESNAVPMPVGEAVKDNGYFAPLAYYQLRVPVVGLPRALNDEAIHVISNFLQDPARKRERFLAVAYLPSYRTLNWIVSADSGTHTVRELGIFDGVKVLEFVPRTEIMRTQFTSGN